MRAFDDNETLAALWQHEAYDDTHAERQRLYANNAIVCTACSTHIEADETHTVDCTVAREITRLSRELLRLENS